MRDPSTNRKIGNKSSQKYIERSAKQNFCKRLQKVAKVRKSTQKFDQQKVLPKRAMPLQPQKLSLVGRTTVKPG